jgi:WD40 repeat protein
LEDCLATGTIANFTKLKIPKDAEIIDIKCFDNKLVAACNDRVVRIWNTNSFTNLRGMSIEESVGYISAMSFSKDGGKFMAATERGMLYVWDGKTLGSNNTLILSQKLSDKKIVSVCWFHYSGEFQSKRLIIMTVDGNVRLFSFTLEKAVIDSKEVFLGKAIELCSIFKIKSELSNYSFVSCHSYSNHVCFSPGRILYLVDYHPSLYYPIVQHQYSHSFESLIPSTKNEVFWQRELFFIEGLEIKRLKETVEKKLSLNSVLEYEGLKILKL